MRVLTLIPMLVFLFRGLLSAADSTISQIRKEYQSIRNALPKLKGESVELSGYSTEGGEARVYRDTKANIRLIKVALYFESGKEIREYYYQNGLLIFAFYESHRYNVPFYVTPNTAKEIGIEPFDPKKTKITKDIYYFSNGKMIRWMEENKRDVEVNSKEFKEAEKNIMDFSNKLIAKFKRKT